MSRTRHLPRPDRSRVTDPGRRKSAEPRQPSRLDVIHLGVSRGAPLEVERLQAQLRPQGAQVLANHAPSPNRTDGFDLSRPVDQRRFARELGLSNRKAVELVELLNRSKAPAAVAALAGIWSEQIPAGDRASRLIVSGHSDGHGWVSGPRGKLYARELAALACLYPDAAAAVRHFHASACHSDPGYEGGIWLEPFPNLVTALGYTENAPYSDQGAADHLVAWEGLTRSPKAESLSENLAGGTRHADHIRLLRLEP